ncbi:baseplate J/gp47 family protein [Cohnella hongkongensis]|uniref:Baseplate J/gp47 family protein n=1 Tax=Cohnella hongkongensis TaxID=178337 RepID=A0ABV9FFE3_9BACL
MAAMPEFLQDQTEEAIMSRMLERVPADLDKSEGSYIWDSLSPAAYQLYRASEWAREVLGRGFARTTFGPYLRMRCEEHGVLPRPAVAAAGAVVMTGSAGAAVPLGSRVATPADEMTETSSIEYETTEAAVLDSQGKAVIPIRAVEPGSRGNVPIGAVSLLVQPIAGITGITNTAAVTGGADEESDESLLARYLLKVRQPGTSGNRADYQQWALETPGVSRVQVETLWNGPGTVRIYVLDDNKRAPGQTIVDAVQQHISPVAGLGEGKAPIGAAVTVEAAVEVPLNIEAKLTLASGSTLEQAREDFEAGLADYLEQLAFVDSLVRYNRISAILLDIPRIVDYENLKVNGGGENIDLSLGEVAVIGTVSLIE